LTATVVITGAARGIGFHLTRAFSLAGYQVIATARRISAAKALRDLASRGGIEVVELDVIDPASLAAFAAWLGRRPIDILINNAGVMGGEHQSLEDMDYDAWLHAFQVNTLAPFRVTTALLPNLGRSSGAKVITLTSQMGSLHRKSTGRYAYRSSKAAANKVMQVMALELRDRGIIACPIHPGWVRTDMGGPHASISVEESAKGVLSVIEALTLEDSGRFWTWEGSEHPW